MKYRALWAGLALSACQSAQDEPIPQQSAAIEPEVRAALAPPAEPEPKPEAVDVQAEPDPPAPARIAVKECFEDYCPCEDSAAVSRMLCRNIRGGVPVDDRTMAMAAVQVDTEREVKRGIAESGF